MSLSPIRYNGILGGKYEWFINDLVLGVCSIKNDSVGAVHIAFMSGCCLCDAASDGFFGRVEKQFYNYEAWLVQERQKEMRKSKKGGKQVWHHLSKNQYRKREFLLRTIFCYG